MGKPAAYYTEGLFDSLPNLRQRGEELVPIKGLMPDPMNLPQGCTFAERTWCHHISVSKEDMEEALQALEA